MKKAVLVSRNVKPSHAHDCAACRFLGSLDGEDLYRCANDGSFVRRFGGEDHENGSLGDLAPQGTPYALAAEILRRGLPPNAYRTA